MTALTHALLRDYADAFHTYGELSNPVWFLGLEEGGGETLDEARRRILRWDASGRENTWSLTSPDLAEAHRDSPFLRRTGKPAKLQTTWSNQLRVLLGMGREPSSNDRVRYLQTSAHGQLRGPTCLMELFPLPCPNAGAWVYGDVPHDPATDGPNVFATKRAYREHYLSRRLDAIAALVEKHRPAALVCTSWTHRGPILALLDDEEVPDLGLPDARREARIGRLHDTVVAVCSHPADRVPGPRNAFYHALGGAIERRMRAGVDLGLAA